MYLQGFCHSFYAEIANDQHMVNLKLEPKRGTIFDRDMRVLALNLNCDSVYANAREIKNKEKTAQELAAILGLSEGFVYDRISRDKAFVWIKRRITPSESAALKKAKLKGISFVKESKRFYPNSSLACHLLGSVNIDNNGMEGLEMVNNRFLKGQYGWLIAMQDARRKILQSYQDEYVPPKDGFNLVLTIDEVIQNIAERELSAIYAKYNAKGASIVVMDPKNGDILALASLPNFDINNVSQRPADSIRNRVINDFYEPGSIFKIVTASAALEENVVDMNDTFFCESGEYNTGRKILHDVHPYGTLTFREVIEKSSNIGTVKVAALVGEDRLYGYIKAFGFGDKTNIELPGEVSGIARPPSKWSKNSMYAIPIGQEVTVTALQLASAIAVIADNGFLVKPRIVKEIINNNGETVREFPPKVVRKVISPRTAARMRALLQGVVDTGTGKKARVDDYKVGGKTGTAQKIEPTGGYSHNKFIASFIGFAPVDKPVIAVVVSVDEPRGAVYYGGDVAAPVFKQVVDQSLKYLNTKAMKTIGSGI